jgi:hypothetical protein
MKTVRHQKRYNHFYVEDISTKVTSMWAACGFRPGIWLGRNFESPQTRA